MVVGGGLPPRAFEPPTLSCWTTERQRIPYGILTLADGRSATLNELASTQARLLVILNPHCGPCDRIAARLDDWVARLEAAVGVTAVYAYQSAAENDLSHDRDMVAFEPEHNVRRSLGVGTPSAVLLGADGFLACGLVRGEDQVAEFVGDVLAELAIDRAP